MNEIELINIYESQKEMFLQWGEYIRNCIIAELSKTKDVNIFLKTEVRPRVKETNSLIQKAFYRNKGYLNPYDEITDKVGIRFVVLLIEDIHKICKIVETIDTWSYSQDRNFEDERDAHPNEFVYQSVHYILRNKKKMEIQGVTILDNTPCEVQIRTLLQHAYSELTHDTIYKPKTKAEPKVQRIVARSMALIETTDNLFEEVKNMIDSVEQKINDLLPVLNILYNSIVEPQYEEKLNSLILDAYKDEINQLNIINLKEFVCNNKFLENKIKAKYDYNLLYRQPIILLLYYLVSKRSNTAKKLWPLTEDKLQPLYTDLGISLGF